MNDEPLIFGFILWFVFLLPAYTSYVISALCGVGALSPLWIHLFRMRERESADHKARFAASSRFGLRCGQLAVSVGVFQAIAELMILAALWQNSNLHQSDVPIRRYAIAAHISEYCLAPLAVGIVVLCVSLVQRASVELMLRD